jgi:uncharacterized membrane-anchored protein
VSSATDKQDDSDPRPGPDPGQLRVALNNEWHARPLMMMQAPLRCTHLVCLRGATKLTQRRAAFAAFCRDQGQSEPNAQSRHHSIQVGNCLVKWEGHTEADAYTMLVPGNGEPPFSTSAADFLESGMRATLEESRFVGVHVEVLPDDGQALEERLTRVRSLLGASQVYGGSFSDGLGELWSSFRLDADGYLRLIVTDFGLGEARLSRYLQRILEIESYRLLAMLGLPVAREVMATLGELELELDNVMAELSHHDADPAQERQLERITRIAARVEHVAAEHAYRFAAARAYSGIVDRRLAELAEIRNGVTSRYSTFLTKTLQPAMRTCEAVERRTQELAQRVTRATQLLDSMVDMDQKKQNKAILESMAERASLQLRLQQSVEGFSIFAITYYAVGLLGYLLKSGQDLGLPLDPSLLTGISAPLVLTFVWLSVRSVKKRLKR